MHTHEVITLMSLNEPGVLYDAAKGLNVQDGPVMAGCDPDAMLWQEQALKTHVTLPSLTPILARTGHQNRTTWVKGDKTKVRARVMSTTTWASKAAWQHTYWSARLGS